MDRNCSDGWRAEKNTSGEMDQWVICSAFIGQVNIKVRMLSSGYWPFLIPTDLQHICQNKMYNTALPRALFISQKQKQK